VDINRPQMGSADAARRLIQGTKAGLDLRSRTFIAVVRRDSERGMALPAPPRGAVMACNALAEVARFTHVYDAPRYRVIASTQEDVNP
jgi:hypothetical protein